MAMKGICAVVETPVDVEAVIRSVGHPSFGAVVPFIGVVREVTGSRRTLRLYYEAYPEMAVAEMERIADEASRRYGPLCVSMVHRTGWLEIGDVAVVVAVGAPHRAEAYEASRFVVDRLKKTVPIWKKEVGEDGEEWVANGGKALV
jgi:molybdopterin synthase catalytic subunit